MKKNFPKSERLRYKPGISALFKTKNGAFTFPFKIAYIRHEQASPIPPQVLITVSKKNFKKAIDRNWIKRRIKELYRLNKSILSNEEGLYTLKYIAFVYVAKEKMPYKQMKKKLINLLASIKS